MRGGVSCSRRPGLRAYPVFPTCVGVFPDRPRPDEIRSQSSPHAWGCFSQPAACCQQSASLPHMRGGVSGRSCTAADGSASSPHAWGCFLYLPSARSVGYSLPHMRGGVSPKETPLRPPYSSSPHAWGCFYMIDFIELQLKVFPTCVGVFLIIASCKPVCYWSSPHAWGCFHYLPALLINGLSLPHMRGGVSTVIRKISISEKSLPHMRGGVSNSGPHRRSRSGVFPTCVGVFP